MSILTMNNDNRPDLARILADGGWVVACLCAAWCRSCDEYKSTFAELAKRHPKTQFAWIDIEDQADLMGDLDVENFPTLLIQRGDIVTYLAPVNMDLKQAERIFMAQQEKNVDELIVEANSSSERQDWQFNGNLLSKLQQALNENG
ncbi:thioredoxin family protein [Glaciimonas soli]|uniref:Thioredoxin n=1 Tax=Glaciimonas soli TaxID=2590999 RepID=A0A843YW87_9BURK|nr:thioredoxin family protein [Glaciimonas soli]MQR01492.1 thioredoxin [Glaciimonas soli]